MIGFVACRLLVFVDDDVLAMRMVELRRRRELLELRRRLAVCRRRRLRHTATSRTDSLRLLLLLLFEVLEEAETILGDAGGALDNVRVDVDVGRGGRRAGARQVAEERQTRLGDALLGQLALDAYAAAFDGLLARRRAATGGELGTRLLDVSAVGQRVVALVRLADHVGVALGRLLLEHALDAFVARRRYLLARTGSCLGRRRRVCDGRVEQVATSARVALGRQSVLDLLEHADHVRRTLHRLVLDLDACGARVVVARRRDGAHRRMWRRAADAARRCHRLAAADPLELVLDIVEVGEGDLLIRIRIRKKLS